MNRGVLVLALALAACERRSPERDFEAPLPVVSTSTSSAWKQVRGGTDPAFSHGDVWVFFSPSASADDRHIPGIGFGDAKGPRFGLIGGYFAPLVALPASDRPHQLSVDAKGDVLRARFGTALDAGVHPPRDGRIHVVLRGTAVILPPADRTPVRTTLRGAPSSALTVSAGDEPEVIVAHADSVRLDTKKLGLLSIDTSCEQLRIIRPVKRGSTSVFAVRVGPAPRGDDPIYAKPGPAASEPCPASTTSTLAFPTGSERVE